MDVGIVGYGGYVPRYRIKAEEIAKVWGHDAESYKKGLMLEEKTVPSPSEDTITISVEASRHALKRANINPAEIGAVYVGSESHPYAVKPSGVTVAEAIGMHPDFHCADFEFACKAGAEAMFVCANLVKSGSMKYALAIGADTSQGAPGDALEYSASAGGAAFIFGTEKLLATVDATYSYATDTPDFWRREHAFYPCHAGRFTGDEAYFRHVLSAARNIMQQENLTADDIDWAVFHMPNGKFPLKAGSILGFPKEKIEPGWLVPIMGNTYSGASPMGLAATLDIARPGDRILMVSYGSGAGSDSFIFTVQDRITEVQDMVPKLRELLADAIYIDYATYAKFRQKIRK
ncbi:hydroxymethylglutaryl-CoA synthase [Candidatus Riflebacteria bacterium]